MKRLIPFICLASLLLGGGLFVPNQVATAQGGMVPRVYLPLVIHTVINPVLNGGFESGAVNWVDTSASEVPQIMNATVERQADPTSVPPAHSGDWLAWMGGLDNEVGTLSQTVLIPSGQPHLTFWQLIDSGEDCNNNDQARILVNSTVRYTFTLCTARVSNNWQQASVDLSAYRNQTVTIAFQIVTNDNILSSLILDDISLRPNPVGGNWTPAP